MCAPGNKEPRQRELNVGRVAAHGRLAYYPHMPTETEQVRVVRATWDDDARVWVAESDDVPGLATEAPSLDALMVKLQDLIPELLELNDSELPTEIPFELLARPSPGPRAPRN